MPTITFELTDNQADAFSQVIKRLARSKLGRDGLNLASQWEDPDAAEAAVLILRKALQDAGFNPR